jgi:hypothetical protein
MAAGTERRDVDEIIPMAQNDVAGRLLKRFRIEIEEIVPHPHAFAGSLYHLMGEKYRFSKKFLALVLRRAEFAHAGVPRLVEPSVEIRPRKKPGNLGNVAFEKLARLWLGYAERIVAAAKDAGKY